MYYCAMLVPVCISYFNVGMESDMLIDGLIVLNNLHFNR